MVEWCEAGCTDGLTVLLTASGTGLRGVHFHWDGPPAGRPNPDHPVLREAVGQLRAYFAGEVREFRLPLDIIGTAFQKRVWRALLDIPYGEVRSYTQIADAIGAPRAVRAVGAANGANPIAIIVPCHRVIGASGRLVGYGGGLGLKRRLLELEGCTMPLFRTNASSRAG